MPRKTETGDAIRKKEHTNKKEIHRLQAGDQLRLEGVALQVDVLYRCHIYFTGTLELAVIEPHSPEENLSVPRWGFFAANRHMSFIDRARYRP